MITFTNNGKLVSDGFRTILRDEFTAVPGSPNIEIVLHDKFESERLATKGEYVRYWIENETIESTVPDGEYRNYVIGLYYYFDTGKKQIQRDWNDLFSDRTEHVRQLVRNNHSYQPEDVYIWHMMVIEEISKPMTVEEAEGIEGYENVRVIKHTIRIVRGNFT
jgi:hypothetical protein